MREQRSIRNLKELQVLVDGWAGTLLDMSVFVQQVSDMSLPQVMALVRHKIRRQFILHPVFHTLFQDLMLLLKAHMQQLLFSPPVAPLDLQHILPSQTLQLIQEF